MIKTETLQFVQSARHVAVYMVLGWYHAVARCLFVLLARIFPLLIRHSLHCHLGLRSLSLPKCRGQLSSLNNRCRNKSGMTNPNHICHPGLRLVSLSNHSGASLYDTYHRYDTCCVVIPDLFGDQLTRHLLHSPIPQSPLCGRPHTPYLLPFCISAY